MSNQKQKKKHTNIQHSRRKGKIKIQIEDMLQFIGGMLFLTAVCVCMMLFVLGGSKKWLDVNATLENEDEITLAGNESEIETEESTKETIEETTEEQTQAPIFEVSIMAVGDNLMHKSVSYSGLQEDGSWDFSGLFANIQSDLDEADVSILCQEVIMGGLELEISGYPAFNTVQELGHSLVKVGFDVVAFANNHTLDQGIKGVSNTISFWKENYPDFCYVGIHGSKEERDNISIIERNGIKIAVLNYTYGLNGRRLPAGQEYWIDLLANEQQMVIDIQKAKVLADFVIVMPHWGTEYSFGIDEQQQRLTQLWADLGVDLVIGSHPHVVQPVKWIPREGYDTPMLVYYSLGNFVSIQDRKERMLGGMAKITIQKQNGKTVISDHALDILVTQYESHPGESYYKPVTTYHIEDYTQELAEKHAIRWTYDNSFSYEAVMQLGQQLMQAVE